MCAAAGCEVQLLCNAQHMLNVAPRRFVGAAASFNVQRHEGAQYVLIEEAQYVLSAARGGLV